MLELRGAADIPNSESRRFIRERAPVTKDCSWLTPVSVSTFQLSTAKVEKKKSPAILCGSIPSSVILTLKATTVSLFLDTTGRKWSPLMVPTVTAVGEKSASSFHMKTIVLTALDWIWLRWIYVIAFISATK